MKDWDDKTWAKWLLHNAIKAHAETPEVRRSAFGDVPMSSHRSAADCVSRYVKAKVGNDHAARDDGLVLALTHWNAGRGALPLHLLMELVRLWKPIGAGTALVHLADSGELRPLSETELDPLVSSAFHTLAKLNDSQNVQSLEAALRKHELWGRERHVLPALVTRTRTSPSKWQSHLIELHRDFRGVRVSSDRAEALRSIAGAVSLPIFMRGIESPSDFADEIRNDLTNLLHTEHHRVLIFDVRYPKAGTRPEKERARVLSDNYRHEWMDIPFKGLLRDLLDVSTEAAIPAEERF